MRKAGLVSLGVIVFFLVLLVAVLSGRAASVQLPYPSVLQCWKIHTAKALRSYPAVINTIKYAVVEIDSNSDGIRDGMLFYKIIKDDPESGLEVSMQPTHVVLDTNYDGSPDGAWHDSSEKGDCGMLTEVPLSTLLADHNKTIRSI